MKSRGRVMSRSALSNEADESFLSLSFSWRSQTSLVIGGLVVGLWGFYLTRL